MKSRNCYTLVLLLVLLFCGAGIACAQYVPAGTTAGGGNIIVGNGTLPALSSSTTPGLSPGGFDQVTLNIGSMATASGQDTIAFTTSHDTLLNNGTVLGAGGGFNAVSFNSGSGPSNETVTNNGTVTGGSGGTVALGGDPAGNGLVVFGGNINTLSITNNAGGIISGGDSNTGANVSGAGVGIESRTADISNVAINNAGMILGGAGNEEADLPGNAISIFIGQAVTSSLISNVTINNTGTILGGNFDFHAEVSGAGIAIETDKGSIDSITINNSVGAIIGGGVGSNGAPGVYLDANGSLSNVVLNNNGSIFGGAGSTANSGSYNSGGIGVNMNGNNTSNVTVNNGQGASIYGSNGVGVNGGGGSGLAVGAIVNANNITINNGRNASIHGGNGSDGGFAGNGLQVEGDTSLSNVAINNGPGAAIYGGYGSGGGPAGVGIGIFGASISGFAITNAAGASIYGGGTDLGSGGAAIVIESDKSSDVAVTNYGLILGGEGQGPAHSGGDGIHFFGMGNSNIVINNWGVVQAGNGLGGATPGIGVVIGLNSIVQTDHVTLNNWGAISAGSGVPDAATAGFPPVAISIYGSNNVINLNGHSSVNGTMETIAGSANNFLNLNFTGMSPAAIAAVKAQLAAQGYPGSNDFTGTFTVRGVTYYVDPLVLNLNLSSYQLQALSPNQQAIGASLDSAAVNPVPGSSLFNLFNAIDASGNVSRALEALSPQKYEAYGDLAIQNTTATVQEIDARLNTLRDGSESIDTTGVGGASDQQSTAGYSKDDGKDSKNIVQTPAPEKRWGLFATGDGLFYRGDSHNEDLQGAKSNTAGTLAGVDAKVGDHFVIGTLFAYDNADATLGSDGSRATIESYSGGIYGSYHQDGFYLNGLAAYTRNHYSSDRNILIPGFGADASANTNGNQASANLDGGYDWHATDRLTLGPITGLQYVHLDVNDFNEIGAGAADLAVNSQDMNSLQSRVGGRVNYHLLTSAHSSLAAELHAAWQHEYLDDSRSIGANFVGDGLTPFSVQTTSPLRDAVVVGLGLNFTFHDRLTLFVDYELLLWRSSNFEQNLNGGGRISF